MQDTKQFRKHIRIQLGMLSQAIKRLEFMMDQIKGKRKLHRQSREKLAFLKRIKQNILRRISEMRNPEKALCPVTVNSVKYDIDRAYQECWQLKNLLR